MEIKYFCSDDDPAPDPQETTPILDVTSEEDDPAPDPQETTPILDGQ